jgi:hypothetical protein
VDILGSPAILLAIAGILTIISGVGIPLVGGFATIVILGLIMIYSAIVSLGYIVIVREVFPVLPVSAVCGGILFLFNLEIMARAGGVHWSLVVGFVAGLVAIFAAFVAYAKPFSKGLG